MRCRRRDTGPLCHPERRPAGNRGGLRAVGRLLRPGHRRRTDTTRPSLPALPHRRRGCLGPLPRRPGATGGDPQPGAGGRRRAHLHHPRLGYRFVPGGHHSPPPLPVVPRHRGGHRRQRGHQPPPPGQRPDHRHARLVRQSLDRRRMVLGRQLADPEGPDALLLEGAPGHPGLPDPGALRPPHLPGGLHPHSLLRHGARGHGCRRDAVGGRPGPGWGRRRRSGAPLDPGGPPGGGGGAGDPRLHDLHHRGDDRMALRARRRTPARRPRRRRAARSVGDRHLRGERRPVHLQLRFRLHPPPGARDYRRARFGWSGVSGRRPRPRPAGRPVRGTARHPGHPGGVARPGLRPRPGSRSALHRRRGLAVCPRGEGRRRDPRPLRPGARRRPQTAHRHRGVRLLRPGGEDHPGRTGPRGRLRRGGSRR